MDASKYLIFLWLGLELKVSALAYAASRHEGESFSVIEPDGFESLEYLVLDNRNDVFESRDRCLKDHTVSEVSITMFERGG